MTDLIHSIKFKSVKNRFQQIMKQDIAKINKSHKILFSAEKFTNTYMMHPREYNKSLSGNTTNTYKRSNQKRVSSFNIETKKIAKKFSHDDRIEKLKEVQVYFTIKNHKEKSPHFKSFRLNNSSKYQIGQTSKNTLHKINSNIRKATEINQWINTKNVINWFNNIKHKKVQAHYICRTEFLPINSQRRVKKLLFHV